MFHKVLFTGVVLAMVGLGALFHHFSGTSDLLKKYQKLGLIESDLRYEKTERAWGNQGLIFYQVRFPFISVPIQADTMTLSLADTQMNVKLKNVHIRVTEGLKNVYGSKMAENLDAYVPYKDFINHLLTSMAVMGIDEFVGDMAVNTVYSDAKTMRFTIDMEQEKKPTIQVEGTIHLPIVGAHQLSDLWNGKVESAEIKVKEPLFHRYMNYAKSRHISIPDFVEQGTLKIKNKATDSLRSFKNMLK